MHKAVYVRQLKHAPRRGAAGMGACGMVVRQTAAVRVGSGLSSTADGALVNVYNARGLALCCELQYSKYNNSHSRRELLDDRRERVSELLGRGGDGGLAAVGWKGQSPGAGASGSRVTAWPFWPHGTRHPHSSG
eukprot:1727467-Pleurochrysis_carterae.AAC.1